MTGNDSRSILSAIYRKRIGFRAILSMLLFLTLYFTPPVAAAIAWPGETWAAATDLTSIDASGWASNLSGAYWNPATRRLWVCTNGPAVMWSLMENGLGGFAIEHEYAGTGDLEGITQTPGASDRVFVVDESSRILRSYVASTGAVSTTWSLTSIPDWGNSGPEGIAFVPDAWLTQSGFVDGAGVAYPQSVYGANGYGGLLFVAVQNNGWVYVFDLRNDGTFTFVGRYLTSQAESCEMTFDSSTGRMYILHNTAGNLIEITNLTSYLSGPDRKFTTYVEVQVPSGSNIEGFALTPALTPASTVGDNWCFFTDDSNVSGALRWFKQLHPTLQKQAGDGQSAGVNTTLPIAPAVLASDAFTNPLSNFSVSFGVASGGGSVTGANATTGTTGIATVGSWQLGPVPGANTLTATGAGLTGSPQTFSATGLDITPPTVTINQQGTQADPASAMPIFYDVVFSEAVTGFDVSDVAQTGSATGVTFSVTMVDASHYTVSATAAAIDGTVRPTIAAGRCVDGGGNGNTASTSVDNTVTLDRGAPTVTINQQGVQADPTNSLPISYDVVFNETVTGFDASDVAQSGTATGVTFTVITVDTSHYTVRATGVTGDGTVQPTIAASRCVDLAGNNNAISTSTDNIVTLDRGAPTVTINQQAAQADPTGALPISYDVVFNEAVTGFDASDVAQSGTATGVTFAVIVVDASHYTVRATGVVGDGTVQPTIASSRCLDLAGNINAVSTSTDNTVMLDRVGPGALITLDSATPTALNSVTFSVDFTLSVAPTFTAADVTLSGTLAGVATHAVSGTDPDYTVTVTMNDGNDDGTIGVVVGTNVTDTLGNPFAGGASPLCTVHNWFGFTAEPEAAKLYEGEGVTLTVAASHGNSTPAYQWRLDTGGSPQDVGGNQPALALSDVTVAERGEYWCEVTYAGSMYETAHAMVEIEPDLSITDPLGADKLPGESHTFSVVPTGGYQPLTYLWKKDGTEITTAPDGPVFTLLDLQSTDAGHYTVEVNDSFNDSAISGEAVLTVSANAPASGLAGIAVLTVLTALLAGRAVKRSRGE